MNKLKERMKAETQKYSQKFFGSPSDSQSSSYPSAPNGGFNQQHQSPVDTSKLSFQALPTPHPQPPASTREIQIANVTELGNVRSLTTKVVRDLGFAGQIGQHILLSYGDTLWTDANYNCEPFRGMTSNSVAIATHDPLKVVDPHINSHGYPDQFVQVNNSWGEEMTTHAVGITNVIETNPQAGEGIIYTLLNHRPEGRDRIVGAGIATVKLSGDPTPVPRATRLSPYIWDGETEPWWGDVGAVRTATHVYAYGHKKGNDWVYVARVPVEDVLRVECYEYWHGSNKGWLKERLRDPNVGEEASVFWQVNQGQVIWSPYFERYLFVYCDRFWSSMIIIRSAPAPEGPWSPTVDVYKVPPITEGGTIYAAAPHPYLDPSGKTLVVSYTNHPNTVQAVKIEFA